MSSGWEGDFVTGDKLIRVLIVEDSPTMAMALKQLLNADPEIAVVGIADDGPSAIRMVRRMTPDLITMDVNLPGIDGLEVTKQIMASTPTPILILSSSSFMKQPEKVFQAISLGALEVSSKESLLLGPNGREESGALIQRIKFLSRMKVISHPLAKLSIQADRPVKDPGIRSDPDRIVAIVGSTGAPQAIHDILVRVPKSFPVATVILIHIAHGFLEGCVRWLKVDSVLPVKIGEHGEFLEPGTVYMAPTGFHTRVTKDKRIELGDDPPHRGLRPNGDFLLESVAEHYGRGAIGVILTGMGRDGAEGIRKIKGGGGTTIAQDEASSTIFGMPKAAIDTHTVDRVVPLNRIPDEIVRVLRVESRGR